MDQFFITLYEIGLGFVSFVSQLWEWFITDIEIGEYVFKPIDSLPIVGVALLVLWIAKTFIPLA